MIETDQDFQDILDEVLDAIDGVVMDRLNYAGEEPEILYALTILHEFGINYYSEGDAWLYGLSPDNLHPGPWTWVESSKILGTWKVFDNNNVVVGDNIPDFIRAQMPKYWSKKGVDNA